MALDLTLVILAGGASSRLWPLREKSLIRFGQYSLLEQQLRRFADLGFGDVVIVANPDNQAIITEIAARTPGLNIRVALQAEPKGMGDALLQTRAAVDAFGHRALYVAQVHDVVAARLHESILAAHKAAPDTSFIAGYEIEDYFPGGYLVVAADGTIREIIEKPGPQNRPSNLVNIVAHLHADAARLLKAIEAEYAKPATSDDHYERAMAGLMAAHPFKVAPYDGYWAALKYPWHVLDIMEVELNALQGQHIAESAFIAQTASIMGDVYIGENVKVFPGAAVVGPAYVGAGTIIGNNSLVRGAMVLENCEVGFTTEIARSYVAENCAMHACRVLDSVFAPGVNFSAGCTSANLRIDRGPVPSLVKGQRQDTGRTKFGAVIGEGAFLGVDVMTMPGVKIGAGAQVGPSTNVADDVPDGARVYSKQEVVYVERESDNP
ncbi:MAG: sugar phosphate nucleotidyltransferase [Anaerolineales bacterium]